MLEVEIPFQHRSIGMIGEVAYNIEGPAGTLQALYMPSSEPMPHQKTSPLAIICHPNPQQGGTMHHKVVVTIARALRDLNIASLRFNFRGVGDSAGKHDGVQGALADAQAVLDWSTQHFSPSGIIWAGFSFGSYIAFQAAQTCSNLNGFICIAPPVDRLDFKMQFTQSLAWLVVLGLDDEVVPSDQMLHWAQKVKPSPKIVAMPGVGHFFHGKLRQLQDAVVTYMQTDALMKVRH